VRNMDGPRAIVHVRIECIENIQVLPYVHNHFVCTILSTQQ
jgi:hypothetical protein